MSLDVIIIILFDVVAFTVVLLRSISSRFCYDCGCGGGGGGCGCGCGL